jgi:hypothetical protein
MSGKSEFAAELAVVEEVVGVVGSLVVGCVVGRGEGENVTIAKLNNNKRHHGT